jgi:hypothetical protein
VLQHLVVTYEWQNGFVSPAASIPLLPGNQLGLTIPSEGTATIKFVPLSVQTVLNLEAFVGTGGSASADVVLDFDGETQDGEPVSVEAAGVINLVDCLRPFP